MGVIGIVSLSLSLRFAVGSLMHKLKSRQKPGTPAKVQPLMTDQPVHKKISIGELAAREKEIQATFTVVVCSEHDLDV